MTPEEQSWWEAMDRIMERKFRELEDLIAFTLNLLKHKDGQP